MKVKTKEPIIELRAFKPAFNLSEETIAYTANVYMNGKRVGYAENRGHGDPQNVHWTDKDAKKEFISWIGQLPDEQLSSMMFKISEDYFFSSLVNRKVERYELKRICRGKLCFYNPEDDPKNDGYRSIRMVKENSKAVRHYVLSKYPKAKILNDEIVNLVTSEGLFPYD